MQKTELTCDDCGRDVAYTGNCEDYRLCLSVERKSPWFVRDGLRGGAVTSMLIYPPIENDAHFCGIKCLRSWLEKNHPAPAPRKAVSE